jgi:hypothetical protein
MDDGAELEQRRLNSSLNWLDSSLLIAISCWVAHALSSIRISFGLFVSVPPRNHICSLPAALPFPLRYSRPHRTVKRNARCHRRTRRRKKMRIQPLSRTYLLAHPRLMTERERRLRLVLSGPRADEPVALTNQLGHLRKLATAEGHAAYSPNNDTLYTRALVESKAQPMILHARRSARCFAFQLSRMRRRSSGRPSGRRDRDLLHHLPERGGAADTRRMLERRRVGSVPFAGSAPGSEAMHQ